MFFFQRDQVRRSASVDMQVRYPLGDITSRFVMTRVDNKWTMEAKSPEELERLGLALRQFRERRDLVTVSLRPLNITEDLGPMLLEERVENYVLWDSLEPHLFDSN